VQAIKQIRYTPHAKQKKPRYGVWLLLINYLIILNLWNLKLF
jgi:hypothetical protein